MASPADLATLRICEREHCEFTVLNGVTDLIDILMAMANHLAAIHPASGGSEGGGRGGGGKSNAPIPFCFKSLFQVLVGHMLADIAYIFCFSPLG